MRSRADARSKAGGGAGRFEASFSEEGTEEPVPYQWLLAVPAPEYSSLPLGPGLPLQRRQL